MRPLSSDKDEGDPTVQKVFNDSLSINGYNFTFDSVADMAATQLDIFEHVRVPLVEHCLVGFNNCGKTYTMWGPANCLSHENDQQGLAPRVFQQLFARISEEQTKHSENQLSYQCHCSFLEVDCLLIVSFCVPDLLNNFSLVLLAQSLFLQIYNEPIMDLLDPNQKNLQEWSKELILLGHMVPVMWSQLISRGRCPRNSDITI
ncbi:hypothetical protein AAZX31_01G012500 [Glycine max]|uniref:Kinesin motor domain-containing protein n=1 Tax=Glycine max TaxID=3847 RepID=K7LE14_SOYBN|nr:kinesin-like protein KIN-12A [Glycine max]XP_028179908.1 kinesin-like protein KIN-12A isoform X1 [Glycine soja]XP_028179909.1 kinesin-like protein KIN-12A isoform X1 [Glycine soja]XP_028193592.1 kinesin-like protein KIN-12A isoform X1 [Glycine soja]XP_028193594.1 kinesin-like protein KIN-12A isoform X1 [Glycine soja]XP_040860878.1 kinesin-like protein KIN-12A [Glycine max]KAH1043088.1 hypothetical protein GYH30_025100 [Glycine max]KAH1161090.1 hypothetical protein GYH30_000127 [Glycine ma|eukprot:XP_006572952.1 kinesin-like protein KIN-12A [Glycine max]